MHVSTHDIHHEYKRFEEYGVSGYAARLNHSLGNPRKRLAAVIFLLWKWKLTNNPIYRSMGVHQLTILENQVGEEVEFEVVKSRTHGCGDSMLKLDYFSMEINEVA